MLSTMNLKLLNQPSKKFRSRYIGAYKIIEKISSQAFKLDLPSNIKVHPVFQISLLKEFNSLAIPWIGSSGQYSLFKRYDLRRWHIFFHSIIDHTISPHPSTYAKGSALLFKVKWEGYESSEDSWEPYVNVKRTDCFEKYYKKSDKFRLLILSNEYKKLSSSYASRFPKKIFGPQS